MNWLIVIGLLCCIFTTGNALTCIVCTEITSQDVTIDIDTRIPSCSSNPSFKACPAGVSSCMTLVTYSIVARQPEPDVVLTKKQRGCLPSIAAAGLIPPGDLCLDKTQVDFFLSMNDSVATIFTGGNQTFDRIVNASFCVCSSADNCTAPSPPKVAEAGPDADGEGSSNTPSPPTVGKTGPDADGDGRSTTTNTPNNGAVNLGARFAVNVISFLCVFYLHG